MNRRGISLTEVLIALGILTIGLLGVAAVFPVGSWYMSRAAVADQGSALAQSVMNDAVTRGLLNPNAWYVMTPTNRVIVPPLPPASPAWNQGFQCDGMYCPQQGPLVNTYTRPFAAALTEALSQPTAASDPAVISRQIGSAFVIDPIGVAALAVPDGSGPANTFSSPFPSSMSQIVNTSSTLYGTAWRPWIGPPSTATGPSPANTWPIRRATVQQADGWQMSPALANYTCSGIDDLSTDLPKRDDRPAMQNWDVYANKPISRQWAGDFSWMLTVLPTTAAARDGMATNPEGFDYQVSVVVFHKRTLPTSIPVGPSGNAEAARNTALERGVKAKVLTTGPNGGELLLDTISSDGIKESAFSQLKVGNWIMLCGPHPNSSDSNPKFVLNWYQVLNIDKDSTGIDQNTQRIVALRGTQWPWQSSPNNNDLSNNLCVAICKGVVAVHTKTLRLENPHGGVFGSGMSLIAPPGVADPNYGVH